MFCPNCGKENRDENNFCNCCGFDLQNKTNCKKNTKKFNFKLIFLFALILLLGGFVYLFVFKGDFGWENILSQISNSKSVSENNVDSDYEGNDYTKDDNNIEDLDVEIKKENNDNEIEIKNNTNETTNVIDNFISNTPEIIIYIPTGRDTSGVSRFKTKKIKVDDIAPEEIHNALIDEGVLNKNSIFIDFSVDNDAGNVRYIDIDSNLYNADDYIDNFTGEYISNVKGMIDVDDLYEAIMNSFRDSFNLNSCSYEPGNNRDLEEANNIRKNYILGQDGKFVKLNVEGDNNEKKVTDLENILGGNINIEGAKIIQNPDGSITIEGE